MGTYRRRNGQLILIYHQLKPKLPGQLPAKRPKRGWLAILWIFSTVVAMVGWWSGLAWGVAWLVERAFS